MTKCNIYLTYCKAHDILQSQQQSKGLPQKDARKGEPYAQKPETESCPCRKDMTQAALAEAVGVSRQTINAIEKGEYNPTINLCRAICKALGKTLDELFWEEP